MSLPSHYHTLRYVAASDAVASAGVWLALRSGALGLLPTSLLGSGDRYGLIGATLVAGGWLLLYALSGLYRLRPEPRYSTALRLFRATAVGVAVGVAAVLIAGVSQAPGATLAELRWLPLLYFGCQLGAVLSLRALVIGWRHHQLKAAHWRPQAILVGGGERAYRLLTDLDRSPESVRPNLVGYIDSLKSPSGKWSHALQSRLPRLGHVDDLPTLLMRRELDLLLLAPDRLSHEQFLSATRASRPFGLTVLVPPDLFDFTVGSYRLTRVMATPLIELRLRVSEPFETQIKRVVDALLSALVLALLSPLLLLLALLIRLDSRGPILFVQERVGYRGRPFRMIKFRSMVHPGEPDGPQLTLPDDPRITRVGRWMRRHHLDELPQLWNVLWGDMSFVGPRPERACYIERIRAVAPEFDYVLQIKPGILGWAQLVNGYAFTLDQMLRRLRYDLLYVQHQSWVLDLKIVLLSLRRIAMGEGR